MATRTRLLRAAAVAGLALLALPGALFAAPPEPASAPPSAGLAPAPGAAPAPPPAPVPPKRPVHRRREVITASMRAVRAANSAALSAPRPNAFLNAALIYDYEPGRLYRIDTSPRFLTTIVLRPGEHLISKAAGDTVRWVIGETTQGSGDGTQALVLIKPVRGGERTNLVLTTDQRTYFLEAVSHDDAIYTSAISWNYPVDDQRDAQLVAARAAAVAAARDAPIIESNLPIDHLNFNYRIEHPKARHGPPWEPTRVFDDGSKTYLQFPPTMASSDAPPLFLIGTDGKAQLVNYRVKGSYYVVDRLIDVAELRLGQAPQTIVRITRTGTGG